MKVKLFYTLGCHLCELAEAMLPSAYSAQVERVEIADDEALLAQYGVRIPVMWRSDDGAELDWPFDEARVAAFLSGR